MINEVMFEDVKDKAKALPFDEMFDILWQVCVVRDTEFLEKSKVMENKGPSGDFLVSLTIAMLFSIMERERKK